MKKEIKKQQNAMKKQKQVELEKRALEVRQQKEDIEKMRIELIKQQEELEKLQEIENQREYDLELIRIELEKDASPVSSEEDGYFVTQTLVSYRPSPLTVMAVPGEAKSPRPLSSASVIQNRPQSAAVVDLNESSMSLPPLPSESSAVNMTAVSMTSSHTSTTFQQEHVRSNSSLATVRDRPVTPIYPPPFPKFESQHQPCYPPGLVRPSSCTPRPSSATPVPVNGGPGIYSNRVEQHHESRSHTIETTHQSEAGFIDVVPSKSVSGF